MGAHSGATAAASPSLSEMLWKTYASGGADPPRVSCTFRSIVPGFEEAWAEIHDPED